MRSVLGAVLGAVALTALACGSARRGEPFVGPLRPADAAVEHGQSVFMGRCQPCHPGGEAGLGPALNDKPLPPFLLRFQVRRGMGAMPAFGPAEITPEELDHLVAFVTSQRRRGPVQIPPARGAR